MSVTEVDLKSRFEMRGENGLISKTRSHNHLFQNYIVLLVLLRQK
jgi:hypothetical protein